MSTTKTARLTKTGQIVETIIDEIIEGQLKPGDQIDPERALTRRFGVSLGTVQRALDELRNRSIVKREQGRGTFVTLRAATVDARFVRFRDSSGTDLPIYIKLLGTRRVSASGPWSKFFENETEFRRIDRIINVGGKFDLVSEFVMTEKSFRALAKGGIRNLEMNLRQAIADRLSLPTIEVKQYIRFELLPDRIARMLKCPIDRPGFVMELHGYTVQRRPIYYQRVYGGAFPDAALVIER